MPLWFAHWQIHTLHVSTAARESVSVAKRANQKKVNKYIELLSVQLIYQPVAVGNLAAFGY